VKFFLDTEHRVHVPWCAAEQPHAQPYHPQTIVAEKPFLKVTETGTEMMANIARGDSQNGFGSKHQAPSIITAHECVVKLAEAERG
jgi:hypothetical protein